MVKFTENGHKYYTLDDKPLISVSGFMHQFEEPKNWYEIAKKNAANLKKYQGIIKTPEQILKEWELKRIKGSDAGTIVHRIKEDECLSQRGEVRIVESTCDNEYKYAINVQELEDNTVYPELMIYDLEHGICGQSDRVEIRNRTIEVLDRKTDKSIDRKAFSSQWTPAEKLLPPLSHLENCNYNIYSLKMSLYMYLIWKANKGRYKPGKILLNWCPIERDEDGIPILTNGLPTILKEEIIEVPYRKKEVIAMLNTLKN